MVVAQKIKPALLHDQAIPLLGIHRNELKRTERYLYTHIHSNIIQKMAKSGNNPNVHQQIHG